MILDIEDWTVYNIMKLLFHIHLTWFSVKWKSEINLHLQIGYQEYVLDNETLFSELECKIDYVPSPGHWEWTLMTEED